MRPDLSWRERKLADAVAALVAATERRDALIAQAQAMQAELRALRERVRRAENAAIAERGGRRAR
jgi:hypothetical protein